MTPRISREFPKCGPYSRLPVGTARACCWADPTPVEEAMRLSLRHLLLVVAGLTAGACQNNTVSNGTGTLPPPQNLSYELDPSGDPTQPAGIRLAWDDVQSSYERFCGGGKVPVPFETVLFWHAPAVRPATTSSRWRSESRMASSTGVGSAQQQARAVPTRKRL